MGQYDIAQICLNGHVITARAVQSPEFKKNKCNICGEPTIISCTNCSTRIKGEYDVPGVVVFGATYHKPMFCDNCGNAYPWTERMANTCNEIVELSEQVTQSEKEEMYILIQSIIKSDASKSISKLKLNRLINRLEQDLKEALNKSMQKF